jgi:SAM-dependent methyltransferase
LQMISARVRRRPLLLTWPIEDDSTDLVTALSVWTLLLEEEARASFSEAFRLLRPGGHAVVSVFVRDEGHAPDTAVSRYHQAGPRRWQFDEPLGNGWFTTTWAAPPELAIGIDGEALCGAVEGAGFELSRTIPGNWTERPGLFFQDILVLRKPAAS